MKALLSALAMVILAASLVLAADAGTSGDDGPPGNTDKRMNPYMRDYNRDGIPDYPDMDDNGIPDYLEDDSDTGEDSC